MIYQQATNLSLQRVLLAALLMALAFLAGCGSTQPLKDQPQPTTRDSTAADVPKRRDRAASAVTAALAQVGVPYRYGGMDRNGFDCSGLVYYAYREAGLQLARTTAGLWETLQPVPKNALRSGDVLFFNIEGKVRHVGIYIGNGRFVHAPSSGRSVQIENLNSGFYRQALVRAGRDQRSVRQTRHPQ